MNTRNWKPYTISDFAEPSENIVAVEPDVTYPLLGLSLEGRGLFIREKKLGVDIGAKTLNQVKNGQFVYSRLFAWKGAFDSVSDSFNGCYVSDEFPTFKIDESIADVNFLKYYFNQGRVWKEVERDCMGVTKASRNRYKEAFFLERKIYLPSVQVQRYYVGKMDCVKTNIGLIRERRLAQSRKIQNLLFSKYCELIEGVNWEPMEQVAPIIRRPVTVLENNVYPELGIRSFGKGTFHKPSLSGVDVGSKKIFQIKEGDLLFSNVFAWEGAIAVAKPSDNNRYGSHRFISCNVNKSKAVAEFLCYHFLTQGGMLDINQASPGGAGRNKTLGLTKLMNIEVPLPLVKHQKQFVELLRQFGNLDAKAQLVEGNLKQMMPTLLNTVLY